ncbi:MAG: hypothetical protein MJZ76_03835 [Bacteroidales bacterium]|nr:hypothetical protein [Bacteroidales bacterium]
MYNEQLEQLIDAALADGELTEKEKQILFKKAQSFGIDLDEFEMVLDARIVELEKAEKEKSSQSAPKSSKYGDVRKCPVCGAIVQAYQAKCSECGYEFSNVDANMSSQKLAEEIKNAKNEIDKKQIITLFPIPNTKADLLEFLTSLQPKMRDVNDPLSSAYYKKYQECISKAQVSFTNDTVVKPFLDSFEKEKKSLKRKQNFNNIKHWCSRHKILTAFIVLTIISLIISGITEITKSAKNDVDICVESITSAITNNDLETAQNHIDNYQGSAHDIAKSYCALFSAYLNKGEFEKAKKLVDNLKSDDGRYTWPSETKQCISKMYSYMISAGKYDDAEEYIPDQYVDADSYYNYLKACVEKMMENEETNEAKKFIKRKVVFFEKYNDEASKDYTNWNTTIVEKKLNAIVENY